MDQDPTPWLTQHWQKGDRYYVAEVVQDLFGLWLVKRSWGSLHTHRGNDKTVVANNYEQAVKLFQAIEKRRKARGYHHA